MPSKRGHAVIYTDTNTLYQIILIACRNQFSIRQTVSKRFLRAHGLQRGERRPVARSSCPYKLTGMFGALPIQCVQTLGLRKPVDDATRKRGPTQEVRPLLTTYMDGGCPTALRQPFHD